LLDDGFSVPHCASVAGSPLLKHTILEQRLSPVSERVWTQFTFDWQRYRFKSVHPLNFVRARLVRRDTVQLSETTYPSQQIEYIGLTLLLCIQSRPISTTDEPSRRESTTQGSQNPHWVGPPIARHTTHAILLQFLTLFTTKSSTRRQSARNLEGCVCKAKVKSCPAFGTFGFVFLFHADEQSDESWFGLTQIKLDRAIHAFEQWPFTYPASSFDREALQWWCPMLQFV
jgi:hypothetical protein